MVGVWPELGQEPRQMNIKILPGLLWMQALDWLPALWLLDQFTLLVVLGVVPLVLENAVLYDILAGADALGLVFLNNRHHFWNVQHICDLFEGT